MSRMDEPAIQSSDSAVLLVPTVDDEASSGASSCDNDDSTKDERGDDHSSQLTETRVFQQVLCLGYVVCRIENDPETVVQKNSAQSFQKFRSPVTGHRSPRLIIVPRAIINQNRLGSIAIKKVLTDENNDALFHPVRLTRRAA
jgi:hypothetical protein